MNDNRMNYNLMALRGDETVDDMDVCTTLGLDPKYAYTPELNDVALQQQMDANIAYYTSNGMDMSEAKAKAQGKVATVQQEIAQALANRKTRRV